MNRTPALLSVLLLIPALLLPACTDRALDPRYPAAILSFDPGLAGAWHALDDDGARAAGNDAVTLTIAAAKVPLKECRLDPHTEADEADETTDGYTVTITPADPERPTPIHLNAYRLSINGRDYIGAQLSFKQFEASRLAVFVAPVHYIVRIERDGDILRAWGNQPALAWLPASIPLDPLPADSAAAAPPLPPENADAFALVTTDIDRLLALLSRPDADTLFTGEPKVFRRAPD